MLNLRYNDNNEIYLERAINKQTNTGKYKHKEKELLHCYANLTETTTIGSSIETKSYSGYIVTKTQINPNDMIMGQTIITIDVYRDPKGNAYYKAFI